MKTLKSDIFYAMNEINDKYILEAAQCLDCLLYTSDAADE